MRECHEAKHFSVSFCLSRQKLRNMRRASKNLAPILGERIHGTDVDGGSIAIPIQI